MIYAIFKLALGSICVGSREETGFHSAAHRFHLQLRLREVIEFPKKFPACAETSASQSQESNWRTSLFTHHTVNNPICFTTALLNTSLFHVSLMTLASSPVIDLTQSRICRQDVSISTLNTF